MHVPLPNSMMKHQVGQSPAGEAGRQVFKPIDSFEFTQIIESVFVDVIEFPCVELDALRMIHET
jgi:hypothetical protein